MSIISMSSNCKVLSIKKKVRVNTLEPEENRPVAKVPYSSEEDRMIINFVNKGKPLTTLHLPGRTIHGIYGRLQRLRKEGKQ